MLSRPSSAVDLRDVLPADLAAAIRDKLAIGERAFLTATRPPCLVASDRFHVDLAGEEPFLAAGNPVPCGGQWRIEYECW